LSLSSLSSWERNLVPAPTAPAPRSTSLAGSWDVPVSTSYAGAWDVPLGYVAPKPKPKPAVVDTNLNTGSTGGTQQTFTYSPTLPSLTPAQQEALMARRRLATRGFAETEASVVRERQRAEADVIRQQQQVERDQQLQSRAGMQTLAGRGVARAPMFVNPFQRQLVENAQRQTGELQSGLAATLAGLETALRRAEIEREREYAQIDFDTASYRSDIPRLLGA
jgi:hypothetical protein